jgi:hypothetical protein
VPDEPEHGGSRSPEQRDPIDSWGFDESLDKVLDLRTWRGGTDLHNLYERIELDSKIGEAIAQEDNATTALRTTFRDMIARDPELRRTPAGDGSHWLISRRCIRPPCLPGTSMPVPARCSTTSRWC